MTTTNKRPTLIKTQSLTANMAGSSSAIDNSAFLESIKQDSHLFQGLGDKNHEPSSFKPDKKMSSLGFTPTVNLRENPQFMELYNENSKLKLKESRLQQTIRELRQQNKDSHKLGLTKKENEELIQLKRQNKQLNRSLFQVRSGQRIQAQKRAVSTIEKEKVTDLLRIIDKYKNQAFAAEEQLKRYQQSQHLREPASVLNNSVKKEKSNLLVSNNHYVNQYSVIKQKSHLYESPSLNIELARLKQQNTFLQSEISRLNAQMSTKNMMNDEIYELKLENQKLQDKVRRMAQSPLFGGMNQRLEDEVKTKALEDKLKVYNQKLQKEKQKVIRLETELKMTQTQLVDANLEAQSTENQNTKLRSRVKQHPIIDVIVRDEGMLQKVIGYLQTENYRSDIVGSIDKNNPRFSKNDPNIKIQLLISQNQLLALELTRNQNMLRTLKDMYEEHQKARQLQQRQFSQYLEQKDKRINQLSVLAGQKNKIQVMKGGIKYEDQVTVFSQDDNIIYESGINYFDIYLAQINLVDTFVRQQVKISDVSRIMSFATVDFYNHQTQNTKVSTGLKYNMNSQFSFKVAEDETLFNYFQKGEVTLNIWTTDGGKTIILGEGKISLKPLISNSKPNLAPVINSSVPLYLHNRSIGSLNFVMRMRLPIYKQLSHLRSTIVEPFAATQSLNIANYQTRKLVVKIQGAEGLPMHVNSFVFYTLNNNDYYTEAFMGSNPLYDHMKIIPVIYTPQFQQYLRRQDLQFTILDDNAPVNDNDQSDLIGTSRIPLSKLLFNRGRMDETLKIVNKNGEIKGNLIIKVFWYQTQDDGLKRSVANGLSQMFPTQQNNIQNSVAGGMAQMFTGSFGNSFNPMNDSKGMYNNNGVIGGYGEVVNMNTGGFYQKPSSPTQINNYIRQQSIKNGINPDKLYEKFDDNNTGDISLGELKQGLILHFGLKLDEAELQTYFASFEKPLTMESFYKGFGLTNQSQISNSKLQKKSSMKMTTSSYTGSTNALKNPKEINDVLRQFAVKNNLSLDDLYRKFDKNKTGVVSKDEIKTGLLNNFNIKLPQLELEAYFRSFKQPIDFSNFQDGILRGQTLATINKFIQKNSNQLKKIPLKEFLKDKNLLDVALEIDQNGDDVISKRELTKYLQQRGVQTHSVVDEKISLVNFLKKHSQKSQIQQSTGIHIPRTQSIFVSDSSSFTKKASRR